MRCAFWPEVEQRGLHRLRCSACRTCGTLNDLLESTWQEWLASVRAGADKLMVKVKAIVGGLSMGAVLALALATERPQQIAGVMALSSTFRHDGWSMPKYTRLAFILPYLRMLGIGRQKCFTKPPYGIKDKALRKSMVSQMHAGNSAEAGLPGNPFWSVVEMQKLSSYVLKRLARVQAPSLVLHSSHDDIASVKMRWILSKASAMHQCNWYCLKTVIT